MRSLTGHYLLKQMVLIKYFKLHVDAVLWSQKQCFVCWAVVQRRSLCSTPWACKLNSKFNSKVTKYFLSILKEFGLQMCALVWFEMKKTTLICSRNVIWERVQPFCCLNLPTHLLP